MSDRHPTPKEMRLLHGKLRDAKNTIKQREEQLQKKNIELDALQRVWCSGGCEGGVTAPHPTDAEVAFAIHNTERLISWHINSAGKPYHGGDHGFDRAGLSYEEMLPLWAEVSKAINTELRAIRAKEKA